MIIHIWLYGLDLFLSIFHYKSSLIDTDEFALRSTGIQTTSLTISFYWLCPKLRCYVCDHPSTSRQILHLIRGLLLILDKLYFRQQMNYLIWNVEYGKVSMEMVLVYKDWSVTRLLKWWRRILMESRGGTQPWSVDWIELSLVMFVGFIHSPTHGSWYTRLLDRLFCTSYIRSINSTTTTYTTLHSIPPFLMHIFLIGQNLYK